MGRAKEEMLQREAVEAMAVEAAVRAGAVTRCMRHPEVTMDQGNEEANRRAYAIGTNLIKSGEVDADRIEFMDAIKAAIEEGVWGACPLCERDDS